jgi:sialate O-acetylesterase
MPKLGAMIERFAVMSFKYIRYAVFAAWLFLAAGHGVTAQPTPGQATPTSVAKSLPFVSPIFGDDMVLQRSKPNTIWGWSDPGDTVRVQIGANTATGTAGPDRRWVARILPPAPGGPYSLTITGHKTVELHNVLVGDVWLCGGQSNMGLPLRFAKNADDETKAANYPDIRFFTVGGHPAYHRVDVIDGNWRVVSPDTASLMSAVAYYFARRVHQEIHVPVGLVIDAVGGTPAESWTSAEALRPLRDFDVPLAELDRLKSENASEYGNYVTHWYDQYDIGERGNWATPDFDDSTWKSVPIPGGFVELGVPDTPALVWFRREITLPDPLPAGRAMLYLGEIERMDTVYINGKSVGGSAWVENPRVYPVSAALKPDAMSSRSAFSKPSPTVVFFPSPTTSDSASATKPAFRSLDSGKRNSASTLVRRNRCPSGTRTGPLCRLFSTRACSLPSPRSPSAAPSGIRASRTHHVAINTARSFPR